MSIDVLIVEDHKVLSDALAAALSAHGFDEVRTAGSVAEAVGAAKMSCPDVVLMDFRLPDGDGASAALDIRSNCPKSKIVMLTAEEHDSVIVAAIEAGCCGYLLKKTKLEEVIDAVRAAHAGEALISPSMLARVLPKLRGDKAAPGTRLSNRELEVLQFLAEGRSPHWIAKELFLSQHTVRNHIQNLMQKLGAHSKLEAVAIGARTGILRLPYR